MDPYRIISLWRKNTKSCGTPRNKDIFVCPFDGNGLSNTIFKYKFHLCKFSFVIIWQVPAVGDLNILRLDQKHHGCHFADDILQCIFLNENYRILIRNSLKFVPTDLINKNDKQATSPGLTNEAGIILCIHPANERRRYNVTYLIGWINALAECIVYCHIYPSVNTSLQK